MQNKRVAIVILNWNKFEYSKNCIQSLKNSNFNDFDIIFIDNGSSDFSGKRINDEFPEIIFIELSTNLGFAGGNNIGLQFAVKKNYEYVMMLNNDVYVDKNFLFHLINYLDFHCEAGAVQSLIFNHPNRQCVWNGGGKFFNLLGMSSSNKNYIVDVQPNEIDWISGCAFLIRTSVLREVGYLNEHYFAYYEDVDLSFRIKKAGYKLVIIPKSIIYHIGGGSFNTSEKSKEGYQRSEVHYYNIRNNIWIMRSWLNWYEKPSAILYITFYSLFLVTYFFFRLRWKKFRLVLRGFIHGFTINHT